jgi:hypothetical protein
MYTHSCPFVTKGKKVFKHWMLEESFLGKNNEGHKLIFCALINLKKVFIFWLGNYIIPRPNLQNIFHSKYYPA